MLENLRWKVGGKSEIIDRTLERLDRGLQNFFEVYTRDLYACAGSYALGTVAGFIQGYSQDKGTHIDANTVDALLKYGPTAMAITTHSLLAAKAGVSGDIYRLDNIPKAAAFTAGTILLGSGITVACQYAGYGLGCIASKIV